MNGLDVAPQTFLYGCVLESGKEVTFNPKGDGFEHQLDLRMACADPATKNELHLVEVEGHDSEGQKVTATLVSLNPATLPSVSLGGFTIIPPAVFRLTSGSGPIHISGQHLVLMESDQSLEDDEEDDIDDDEEEEEEQEALKASKKRPAASPVTKSQKKKKMEFDAEEEDDDEDDEDDDEEEETPAKAKPAKKSAQNGKSPKATTPSTKQVKTPKQKADKSPKNPATPKETLTLPEIQTKMTEAIKKGIMLPKVQAKFENFVKNSYRVTDSKVIAELWKWRQTVADAK
ncbi:nucleophosmin 1a isoform X2 [Syngnathoides biaculeatus]|uniref:nucleophosmin 1a isoform X2 n=1 Tax=Syngnathoides biaculeatus TaxID=300417 RepID=UPI002ADD5B78|nr:nucleophosmin 1a isoform X2 [Syngnathoides biaculeatus]